jgi:hypothetical protein
MEIIMGYFSLMGMLTQLAVLAVSGILTGGMAAENDPGSICADTAVINAIAKSGGVMRLTVDPATVGGREDSQQAGVFHCLSEGTWANGEGNNPDKAGINYTVTLYSNGRFTVKLDGWPTLIKE